MSTESKHWSIFFVIWISKFFFFPLITLIVTIFTEPVHFQAFAQCHPRPVQPSARSSASASGKGEPRATGSRDRPVPAPRSGGGEAAPPRRRTAGLVGTRHAPDPQGRAQHRRPGGCIAYRSGPPGRGHSVPSNARHDALSRNAHTPGRQTCKNRPRFASLETGRP